MLNGYFSRGWFGGEQGSLRNDTLVKIRGPYDNNMLDGERVDSFRGITVGFPMLVGDKHAVAGNW
jgi:hypothetical protein